MKVKDFVNLGISEEIAIQCEKLSLEELKEYIPKSRFDEVNKEKKRLESDIKLRDEQLEELKKLSGDNESLKSQINQLQKDNKLKDEKYIAEMKQFRVDIALDKALKNAKAKNAKAVKALLELNNVELNNDGSIKGLDEQINNLISNDDTRFLFDIDQPIKFTGVTPGVNKDGLPDTSGYQQRLVEARSNGNTLEAIKIKQEAQKEGIILI